MALGGGVFVTQNKTLPGSYINFVNASNASSTVGDRGVVAIALPLGKSVGEVIEVTSQQFLKDTTELLGCTHNDAKLIALREIFLHANKVYVYDLGSESSKTVEDACAAFESYDFNILCAYTDVAEDIATYIAQIKAWRDELGKKCQVVVYNAGEPDHEGVINVVSTVSNEGADSHALVAWVAGAEAGCALNATCTNMTYDGEYDVVAKRTQKELEDCLNDGKLVFHLSYGNVCLLEDINSLTTFDDDKSEDFQANQTIRVIDQIANDIAKLFNTKYLGKIPNNNSGRTSLWADIVSHHRKLEDMQAIEQFDATALKVEQGESKKSVVVNDVVTVTNAMAQLYMTVVIQ